MLAVLAQHERKLISERTKAALAVRKEQRVKLGGYCGGSLSDETRRRSAETRRRQAVTRVRVALDQIKYWRLLGHAELARRLNGLGIPTALGRGTWTAEKARAAIKLLAEG